MENQTLIIIGGGIIGHMAAWRANALDPSLKITIIERDLPGVGASAHSAGLHFPLSRTQEGRAFSLASQQFYKTALQQVPSLPINPLKLRIHSAVSEDAALREAMTEGAGLTIDPDGASAAKALGSSMPVWTALGANRADVRGLVMAIRRALTGKLRVIDGVCVRTVKEGRDGVALDCMDGSNFTADRLLLAPGPWALEEPFRPFVEGLGIRIKRVVAFHIDEVDGRRDAVDLFFEADAFLMPKLDGKTLFSFTRFEWDVSPDEADRGVSAADRAEAENVILKVAPRLSGRLNGGQAFCDAYSRDRVPIATSVGERGRIAFAGAANGSGYRFAPTIAERALSAIGLAS